MASGQWLVVIVVSVGSCWLKEAKSQANRPGSALTDGNSRQEEQPLGAGIPPTQPRQGQKNLAQGGRRCEKIAEAIQVVSRDLPLFRGELTQALGH